jgi:hypothetical protein
MRNCLIALTLAVAFLVAANVKADLVTTDYGAATFSTTTYTDNGGYSVIILGSDGQGFDAQGKPTNAPGQTRSFNFTITAEDLLGATVEMNSFNNGNSNVNGGNSDFWLTTNQAGTITIKFQDEGLDSFYLYSSSRANPVDLTVTAWGVDSDGQSMMIAQLIQQTGTSQTTDSLAFFGFLAYEGYSITSITLTTQANSGTTIGVGDQFPAAVPAPGTMMLMGLGLAGLGAARARRRK